MLVTLKLKVRLKRESRASKAIVYIYWALQPRPQGKGKALGTRLRALLKPLQRWTSLEPLTLVKAYNPFITHKERLYTELYALR